MNLKQILQSAEWAQVLAAALATNPYQAITALKVKGAHLTFNHEGDERVISQSEIQVLQYAIGNEIGKLLIFGFKTVPGFEGQSQLCLPPGDAADVLAAMVRLNAEILIEKEST